MPAADAQTAFIVWSRLTYMGCADQFLKQLDALVETFPLPPLSLMQIATAPLERAFAAEVRNAGLYTHASGQIPYSWLRQIIANKLEAVQEPTDRPLVRPPKEYTTRAALRPKLRMAVSGPSPPHHRWTPVFRQPFPRPTRPPSPATLRQRDPGLRRGMEVRIGGVGEGKRGACTPKARKALAGLAAPPAWGRDGSPAMSVAERDTDGSTTARDGPGGAASAPQPPTPRIVVRNDFTQRPPPY